MTLRARGLREQPRAVSPAVAQVPSDWLRGTRILIVEDHHDSREVMRQIVESFGATVRVAQEGYEALEIAAAWIPDLILCDLMMPGMDGYTLMGRLKADPTLRASRVVAVSVLAGDADFKRTWLAGFDGHIVKPIDYDLLAALLERVFWAHRRV